ncbi:MAG: DNA polymerase III subunit gamma/tau, partial [Candidatus Nanopelagicales bacterium]
AKGRKKSAGNPTADSDGTSADVVEPVAAAVVETPNGASAPEAPTPRARGTRRRVTRSAGPAALEVSREDPEPAV